jgi:hypothetical protein
MKEHKYLLEPRSNETIIIPPERGKMEYLNKIGRKESPYYLENWHIILDTNKLKNEKNILQHRKNGAYTNSKVWRWRKE